jgi:hypothetical protein
VVFGVSGPDPVMAPPSATARQFRQTPERCGICHHDDLTAPHQAERLAASMTTPAKLSAVDPRKRAATPTLRHFGPLIYSG